MNSVIDYKCYKFKKDVHLIDVTLDVDSDKIDWENMVVPEENVDRADWQVPYMEQYLTLEGDEKICESFAAPSPAVRPCRVAFFIVDSTGDTLRTPYGDLPLDSDEKVPKSLKKILDYEPFD